MVSILFGRFTDYKTTFCYQKKAYKNRCESYDGIDSFGSNCSGYIQYQRVDRRIEIGSFEKDFMLEIFRSTRIIVNKLRFIWNFILIFE